MGSRKIGASEAVDDRLISLDALASRWGVSRSTARRVVDQSKIAAIFLTGAVRGVRRYRLADILKIETEAEERH